MRFTGTLRTIVIDKTRFKRELDEELQEILAKSAFAWFNVAISIIPVWSGAAKSTFKPLADTLGFQLSVSPKITAPDRRSLGESQGEGDFDIVPEKGRYFFKYSTSLDHLIFNEFNASAANDPNAFAPSSITGLPYGFQEQAQQAWQKVANTARLPAPQIRVGKTIRIG